MRYTSRKPIREASRRLRESSIDSIIRDIKLTLGDIFGGGMKNYELTYGDDPIIFLPDTEWGDNVGTFASRANYECFDSYREYEHMECFKPVVSKGIKSMKLDFDAIATEEEAETVLKLVRALESEYCIDPDGADDYYWDELERASKEACPDYDWDKLVDFMHFLDEEDIYDAQRGNYGGVKIEIDEDLIKEFEEDYED